VLGTIPDFLLGVALVAVFAVDLGWFPVASRDGAASYVLPVLALAIGPAAVLARIVRVEMLTVLETDYVRTARAKRLPALRIHLRHALPNAVTATLTLGGMLLASMVAGTVLVENVFAWPGLGSTIVESIVGKDYPLVQGTVLVYGVIVLVVNNLVDVALALLDPRSTIGES
jgi:peptide/nickel transport system permease protein